MLISDGGPHDKFLFMERSAVCLICCSFFQNFAKGRMFLQWLDKNVLCSEMKKIQAQGCQIISNTAARRETLIEVSYIFYGCTGLSYKLSSWPISLV